jgi:hypothetical protein
VSERHGEKDRESTLLKVEFPPVVPSAVIDSWIIDLARLIPG